ncbi:hypothetical protein HG531_011850 [Fusarium graminearum]|nr:hypothetical protein HG531_011850 [Fusarium graminearum]
MASQESLLGKSLNKALGQRADFGGQLGRQQSAEAVLELNGCASLLRLTIHKGVGLDKVSNVRNMDTNLNLAIRAGLGVDCIAKLGAPVEVNCESLLFTVVAALGYSSLVLLLERPILETDAAENSIRELI